MGYSRSWKTEISKMHLVHFPCWGGGGVSGLGGAHSLEIRSPPAPALPTALNYFSTIKSRGVSGPGIYHRVTVPLRDPIPAHLPTLSSHRRYNTGKLGTVSIPIVLSMSHGSITQGFYCQHFLHIYKTFESIYIIRNGMLSCIIYLYPLAFAFVDGLLRQSLERVC